MLFCLYKDVKGILFSISSWLFRFSNLIWNFLQIRKFLLMLFLNFSKGFTHIFLLLIDLCIFCFEFSEGPLQFFVLFYINFFSLFNFLCNF